MNKKYEILEDDTKEIDGIILHRIRAIKNFGLFKVGTFGGYIESEKNLSQDGNSWVYGNAQVYGNAWASGNARVFGNAWVYGDACVYGDARVYDNARVFGNAWVYGNAQVSGDALVYGNARVSGDCVISESGNYLIVGPAKSSVRYTTAHLDEIIGIRVNCGCFSGSLQEFHDVIQKTHKDNPTYLKQYMNFYNFIRINFDQ